MRIGVVTFWNSEDNYGQILQCYALQRFLIEQGHDAFLVRYLPLRKRRWFKDWIGRIRYVLCSRRPLETVRLAFEFKRIARAQLRDCREHPRHFAAFKERHIRYSDRVYDQYELQSEPPWADAFVSGSDQIWRGIDPVFFLDFVPAGIPRIAYAASFGSASVPTGDMAAFYRRCLAGFKTITVRETEGVEICRQLGFPDVELVPDPTFLLPASHYVRIASPVECRKDFLFLYLLGNEMDFDLAELYAWAVRRGLNVIYVASQGRVDAYPKTYPNVDEWLGYMIGAKYVVTNSFHGMAMSIVLNKDFVVLPLRGTFAQMNGRIRTTLTTYGLTDRLYGGDPDLLLSGIDYEPVNRTIEMRRKEITEKFESWLQK